MADFETTYQVILSHEGGFVLTEIEDDAGGKTYAGISFRSHPDWTGWKMIEQNGSAPTLELRNAVRERYLQSYWNRIKGDDITNQNVASAIMSLAVLSGVATAARMVQVSLKMVPDSIIGPISIDAINEIDPEKLLLRLYATRTKRYRTIVRKKRSQKKFFEGWVSRALDDLEGVL